MDRDLSTQIVQAMTQYSDAVKAEIKSSMESIGDTALQKVKAGSPKRTGKYRRGWKLDTKDEAGRISFTVHQKKPTYRLTHLLEDGHRTCSKKGWVKAQPHIRNVEQWAADAAARAIEKAVKG